MGKVKQKMLEVNQVLNDTYQVTEYIRSGGGGIVYKAKHLRLETDVVIKQIREEVRDKIYLRQEADILKNLKHPYLPRVYDFLMTDDGVYTVMDFVPGEALDKLLSGEKKIPQDMALRWMNQLAEALAYLHGMHPPIIHSDIKPANIMITPENNAVLIDFNVSICMDGADKFSIGISAGYAPPEQYRDLTTYQQITHIINTENTKIEKVFSTLTQASKTVYLYEPDRVHTTEEGDATEVLPIKDEQMQKADKVRHKKLVVDTRSDVYSLGCVFYHMLTGKAPALDFNKIVPISQMEPDIREGVIFVLEKMMRLLPDERYQDGKETLEAIRNCHKFDRRYISMKRKEKGVAVLASGLIAAGIVLLTVGSLIIRKEENAFYENTLLEAETLAAESEYEDAITIARNMEEQYPDRLKAYERECYYLYMSSRYQDVIARMEQIYADQLIAEDGTKENKTWIGNLSYILARSYYEMGDYGNAQIQIETALQYLPEHADVYRDYALIRAKRGDVEGAEQLLSEAKELGLDGVSMQYAQAEMDVSQGNYERAIEHLQSVLLHQEQDEIYRRAVLLAGSAYQALQDYPEQIALYREAVGWAEGFNKLLFKEYLAGAYASYAETGEVDRQEYLKKALALFEEIRESGYATFQLKENIAVLKEKIDDFDGAREQLLQMKEEDPNNYRVYKRLAILEADIQQQKENRDRDYQDMSEYYEQAERLYSDSGEEDMEMQMLRTQMQDVRDGGWLSE